MSHRTRFHRVPITVTLLALAAFVGDARGVLIEFEASLTTNSQSMWGPGGAGSLSYENMFFDNVGWGSRDNPVGFGVERFLSAGTPEITVVNPRWRTWNLKRNAAFTAFGRTIYPLGVPGPQPPMNLTIPAIDLGTVGLGVEGTTHGRFGLGLNAELTSGNVNAAIPMSVTLEFDETQVRPGQKLTIRSDYILGAGAKLETVSPEARAGLFLDVDMSLNATSDVKLGNAVDVPPIVPSLDVNNRIELLGLDNGDLKVMGIETGEFANTLLEEIADRVAAELGVDDGVSDAALELLKIEQQLANREQEEAEASTKIKEFISARAEHDRDKAIESSKKRDATIAQANADNQKLLDSIEGNNQRIGELDATLNDPDASDDDKAKAQAEKQSLEERNQVLDNTSKSLNDQINRENDRKADDLNRAAAADQLKKDADDAKNDADLLRRELKKAADDKKKSVEDANKSRRKKTLFDTLNKLKDALGKAADALKVFDAEFTPPVVTTYTDRSIDAAGNLHFSNDPVADSERFAEVSLSVDDVLSWATELAAKAAAGAVTAGAGAFVELPPLTNEFSLTDYLNAEYSVLDFNVGVSADVQQAFDYAPLFEVVITMPDGTERVFDLGDEIDIDLPDDLDGFELTPELRVKEGDDFTNTTSIHLQPFAELAVLGAAASLKVPEAFQAAVGQDAIGVSLGPVVGSIDDQFDLMPERYELGPGFTIDVFSESWSLGGFTQQMLGTIVFEAPEFQAIPGGEFDSLDAWQVFGNVAIDDGAARLTAASPVAMATLLDTPDDAFLLQFDYDFTGASGDDMFGVYLDGSLIEFLFITDADPIGTMRIEIDDPLLLGLTDASLLFEYFGATGSSVLIDNVQIAGAVRFAATQAIPEPGTGLIACVMGLLLTRVSRRPAA